MFLLFWRRKNPKTIETWIASCLAMTGTWHEYMIFHSNIKNKNCLYFLKILYNKFVRYFLSIFRMDTVATAWDLNNPEHVELLASPLLNQLRSITTVDRIMAIQARLKPLLRDVLTIASDTSTNQWIVLTILQNSYQRQEAGKWSLTWHETIRAINRFMLEILKKLDTGELNSKADKANIAANDAEIQVRA